MNKIENFEDLHCWQAARVLVKSVYSLSRNGELAKDFELRNQLRRAALSSMNNIAEGFGRFGDGDFIRFLDIAQSSVQEVQSMLYVVTDLSYLREEQVMLLRRHADSTKNLTRGLIKYLRRRGN
jgi:four helix bundle protein